MADHAGFLLDELQRELVENEHQLSELEIFLADYTEERPRDAEEEMQSQAHRRHS
jgi:hypothetical protein